MQKRPSLHLSLLLTSLALLALFLLFWLHTVWDEQKAFLQKEADNVFQRTMLNLQDSLVRRNLDKHRRFFVGKDSAVFDLRLSPTKISDTTHSPKAIREFHQETRWVKTRENGEAQSEKSTTIQIFVASASDTFNYQGNPGLDRVALQLRDDEPNAGKQVFRLERDSLRLSEIQAQFEAALAQKNIHLPFSLLAFENQTDNLVTEKGIQTNVAHVGLLTQQSFFAHFQDYRAWLWQKMLPSLLFSLFLFGITAGAFWTLHRSLRQQQRLTELKNEFVSNITHELKTPITTVGVALEALSDFEALQDPVLAREYIDISKLELERLTLLVEKVLSVSKFEQNNPLMRPEVLDFASLVPQVLNALRLQLEAVGANVQFSPMLGTGFRVTGDRLHLSSVVFNLLDNAIKYRRDDTPLAVELQLEKTEHLVRLSVRDNGKGIDPAFLPKIFERFFRVPSGDQHDVKGHGLGLNYVASVVRQHGGRVWAENAAGGGTVFRVELPAS